MRPDRAALLALALLLAGCGGAFPACRNVVAFTFAGTAFNTEDVQAWVTWVADPFSGTGHVELVLDAFAGDGASFRLVVRDFRPDGPPDCLTVEPYYANPTLNYCVPAVPFACSGFSAEFTDADGTVFSQAGAVGQVVITDCDGRDGRVSGSFAFGLEELGAGASGSLDNGSFRACFALL